MSNSLKDKNAETSIDHEHYLVRQESIHRTLPYLPQGRIVLRQRVVAQDETRPQYRCIELSPQLHLRQSVVDRSPPTDDTTESFLSGIHQTAP